MHVGGANVENREIETQQVLNTITIRKLSNQARMLAELIEMTTGREREKENKKID
jgi:hypothetical protein